MRKSTLLLASVALTLLLVSGVALAATIQCPPHETGYRFCKGTPEDDTLIGTDRWDIMEGLEGNDTLDGKVYVDWLYGHGGNDILKGRQGRDRLWGDDADLDPESRRVRGSDALFGNGGDDFLAGGPGYDRIWGGPGNDYLMPADSGLEGEDYSNDKLFGEDGNDTISGQGGSGYDEFHGGPGQDSMRVASGTNLLDGGAGEDWFGHFGSGSVTYEAVDGELDHIECSEAYVETVRADPEDVYREDDYYNRQHCDSLTIVE